MIRTQLRSFHAVATYGGFTAASKVLHIGQPTLTTQVRALETRYNVDLFHRIGRKVVLTEVGKKLLELTVRINSLDDEAHSLLEAHAGLTAGRLRVAAVGPFHAIDMISEFKQRFPGVEVTVLLGNSQQTIERLLDYQADVAVTAHLESHDRVRMLPYSTHSVVAFVNADHRFFDRSTISIHEMSNERVVMREEGSTTRTAFDIALSRADVRVEQVLEIGSREGVWKAVERGMGIGVVADFEFVAHPRLRTVAFDDVTIRTEYFLAHLHERESSHLIRAFCDVALTAAT